MTEEWTPTEDDEGAQITIEDSIVTMTHPLTGHTLTGPMTWVGTCFARLDLIVGHMKMKEQIEAEMLRLQDEIGEDN